MTLDDIKKALAVASPMKKFCFYIALPLLLLFVLYGKGGNMVAQLIEQSKRKSVDGQDKKIEGQEGQDATQAAAAETQVSELEKEKQDAIDKTSSEDPAAVINDRYKPIGQ